jgi:predicted ABC-type ATPase
MASKIKKRKSSKKSTKPRCIVIAGPNGAGKTTFAREYLTQHADVVHFINADLIAGGLSPLRPELAAVSAGKLVLSEISRLMGARMSFAFESTLSGLTYARRFKLLKESGFEIEIVYLRLPAPKLALQRITSRVKQGGHNVPAADVRRRFKRSWENFQNVYKYLADSWAVYDNSGQQPILVEESQ